MKSMRARKIGMIKLGCKAINIDIEDKDPLGDYCRLLKDCTGKISCGDMNEWELDNVITRLKTLGFKPKLKNKRLSPESKAKKPNQKTPTDKIRAIWIAMFKDGLIKDGSETALDTWVQRMTKKQYNNGLGLSSVAFLEQAGADIYVLEALKNYQKRLEG